MSTPVLTTGWTAELPVVAGTVSTYQIVPGTGGTVLAQWTDDLSLWRNFTNTAVAVPLTGQIPDTAVAVRAIAFDAAGTIEVVLGQNVNRALVALVAEANLAATSPLIDAGVFLQNPTTGLIYGQSDGAGGVQPASTYTEVQESIDVAYASQFAMVQQTLQVRSIPVSATGQAYLGPCAVLGVRAVTLGTGTMTIHDGTAASDAALLRMSRAHSAMVAGTHYPMVSDGDRAALLFDTGVYFTAASGGAYWVDLIDGTKIPGTVGSGQLCVATRVTASGLAINGPATILSIKIIVPGSAGNLDIRGGPVVGSPLLYPSTAYTSLAADQIIEFGPKGGGATVDGLYLTIPTGAIVLVNSLPR